MPIMTQLREMVVEEQFETTPAMLVTRARAMQDRLRGRAAEANRQRDVSAETVAEFKDAELFKMLRPRAFGGFESDPRDFFDVQNAIAEACGSSAWIYGVLSVQYLILATFDRKAQADVFADDPEMLVSSSIQPFGRVEIVEDGYRLSGRWSFSSGSTHAGWALVGGLVPPREANGRPEMRIFLVPKSDYRIDRVWDTFGLSATGSNDLLLDGAFVPEYRSVLPSMGMVPLPDDGSGRSLLHRLPWLYIFTGSVSNFAIGVTRGAVETFAAVMRKRANGMTGKAAKDDSAVQAAISTAYLEADNAESTLRRHIGRMIESTTENEGMPLQEGLLYRAQLTSIVAKLSAAVDAMQYRMGGRGIAASSPLVRPWLDLAAARNHPGNDPAVAATGMAAVLLADPNDPAAITSILDAAAH